MCCSEWRIPLVAAPENRRSSAAAPWRCKCRRSVAASGAVAAAAAADTRRLAAHCHLQPHHSSQSSHRLLWHEYMQEAEAAPHPRQQKQRQPHQRHQQRQWQSQGSTSWGRLGDSTAAARPVAPRFRPASGQAGEVLLMQAADFPAGPLPAVGNAPHRPLPASWRPHKRGAADSPGAAAAAIEQLVALHPWAGRELVAAVLAATQQDAGAAAAVLADMVAPGAQPEPAAPARGPAARAPADEELHKERAGSSSGSDEEDGGEQRDAY